jgi:hypothetical protein
MRLRSVGIGSVHISDGVLESMGFETTTGRIAKLEARLAELTAKEPDRADAARLSLDRGQALSRREAAAFLSVSTKKLQRMQSAGALVRCPGLGSVVRYAARDVLRLASASSRKGA